MKNLLLTCILGTLFTQMAQAQCQVNAADLGISLGSYLVSMNGVVNTNGGTLTVNGTLRTPAHLSNTSGATLQGDGQYRIGGDWTNEAAFSAGTSTVTFEGDQNSTVTSGGGAFNKVHLNKIAADLLLADNMDAANMLDFQATENYVVLGDFNLQAGGILGHEASRHVRTTGTGFLIRSVGASPVDFPVGNTTYNPATLTNAGTGDQYRVRVSTNVLSDGSSGTAYPTDVVDRSWFVEEATPGGSDLTLALQWNGSEEQSSFDRSMAYVSHFDGGAWDSQPAASAGGADPYTLSRSGITSLSPFAVVGCGFQSMVANAPLITCPADQTVSADGACTGTVGAWSAASLADDCGTPTVGQSPAANTVLSGHNDVETVTLTADDGHGHTGDCSFTVTLVDGTPPTIACPANQTVSADIFGNFTLADFRGVAAAADNCTANPSKAQAPAIGATLAIGDHSIALAATDGVGLTGDCAFTLTVQPGCSAPTIICPANQMISAGTDCMVSLPDYTALATVNGGCGNVTLSQSPGIGSPVGLGGNTVTLTATDQAGNTTACMFAVLVADDTPPAIACPGPVTVACSGQVPAVSLAAVSATDNCPDVAKVHVGDATSNMTCANRKTITRTYRATDSAGNSSTCAQIITVFDNVAPMFTFVPANVTVQCSSIPAVGSPSASDGCGGPVGIAYDGQTVTNVLCTDKYTLTRQWTATDACGNTRTATQRITVTDTQKPNFVNAPANVTVQCDAIPEPATPMATDNCDTDVAVTYVGQTITAGTCPNAYTLTRRWTAADNCGNTRSVSQRITVVDNGKPVFASFPADATIACNETPPAVGSPSASDGCGSATVTYLGQSTTGGSCPGNYQIKRTWKATDGCGNSTVSTQTISVSDTDAPVFTSVPGPVTIECNQPLPPLVNPAASDVCGGYVQITFLGNVPSGSGCAADYTVTRSWRAQDLCGNSATASQVITVLGNNSYEGEGAENRAEATPLKTQNSKLVTVNPNPTTDRIWLDLTDFAGEAVTVSIHSDLGQLVWERRIPAVEDLRLSVSLREAGAVAGIYTVSVRSAGGVAAKRVVLVE